MIKYIFILLTFFYVTVSQAETVLCVGEAGAGVGHEIGGAKRIYAKVIDDAPNLKLILSNESGEWSLKRLGKDTPMLITCKTAFYCKNDAGFGRVFFRTSDGIFTFITMPIYQHEVEHIVLETVKGRCSKL